MVALSDTCAADGLARIDVGFRSERVQGELTLIDESIGRNPLAYFNAPSVYRRRPCRREGSESGV